MQLTPEKFSAAVHRNLPSCCLIAGEEPLLIRECVDVLRTTATKAGYDERETFNAGRDFDWNQLIDACATGSLFSTRRIVEVQLEASPGVGGGRVLKELATAVPEGVLLVALAQRLDAPARRSAWYASFERHGVACYAWPVRADAFPAWLATRVRSAGLHLNADAMALLGRQTEGNLLAADQEIAKLSLLYGVQPVDEAAVRASVADSAHFGVFDWIDRLLAGDRLAATRGLRNLQQTGVALPAITPALASSLQQLEQLARRGADSESFRDARVFAMRQAVFRSALARVRGRQVLGWLRRLTEIDVLAKSGGAEEGWRELQALALGIAGMAGAVVRTQLAAAQERL
ncbi:MAG: DNA polymerase III subunit delta [Nevskiaceae bacterium]|nr:MAG: DNA polymerase III subunit delta [Nevskiaceae bacterium]TBR71510.1 MAG: DNA polymerase III subunit delta [Nevskiaceae bacterium]